MKILASGLVLVALAGCYDRLTFDCGMDDDKCSPGGMCVEGACAFAAVDCASGLRFDKSAGARADQCVGLGDDLGVGDEDLAGSDVGDAAQPPDMTITCGTPGLPCCNLTCNPGVTCAGAQCQAANFWVVGGNGGFSYSAHWDGNAWTAANVTGPTGADIIAMWGASAGNIWAVGFSGNSPNTAAVIWHYDGAGWAACAAGNTCTSAGTSAPQLAGIFGISATDIWAVGGSEAVHWDGAAWTSKATGIPASASASAVWCAATADCWIVSSTKMFHWNGADWNTNYTVGSTYAGAVWGFATNDVWAGTGPGFSGAAVLVHWDGSNWSAPATIQGTNNAGVIRQIWGIAKDDIWAVGDNGFTAHFDGTKWSRVSSGTTQGFLSIWGVASKDVWAAGQATLAHWNGMQWTPGEPLGSGKVLNSVWGPVP